jgi:hypothetical protein
VKLILENAQEEFGAGDRGRTGDVHLGNFLLEIVFSIFAATTYLFFCAQEILFLPSAISTSLKPSTFVLGKFWGTRFS